MTASWDERARLSGAFGAVQNGVMMALLTGAGSEAWVDVSYWATLLKLILFVAGAAYAALGGAARLAGGGAKDERL